MQFVCYSLSAAVSYFWSILLNPDRIGLLFFGEAGSGWRRKQCILEFHPGVFAEILGDVQASSPWIESIFVLLTDKSTKSH